jgi:hypothetical protein
MASASPSSSNSVPLPIPQSIPLLSNTGFRLRKLPAEIRVKIYPHNAARALTHDLSPPPLLSALYADTEMYIEARELYYKINVSVSPASIDAFKQKDDAEMEKIMHIRIRFTPANFTQFMNNNKLVKENQLRSIMVVPWAAAGEEDKIMEAVRVLCKASSGSVRKVVVVAVPEGMWPLGSGSSTETARKLSVRLPLVLGAKGTMVEYNAPGQGLGWGEIWSYEAKEVAEGFTGLKMAWER